LHVPLAIRCACDGSRYPGTSTTRNERNLTEGRVRNTGLLRSPSVDTSAPDQANSASPLFPAFSVIFAVLLLLRRIGLNSRTRRPARSALQAHRVPNQQSSQNMQLPREICSACCKEHQDPGSSCTLEDLVQPHVDKLREPGPLRFLLRTRAQACATRHR